jgi:hypothetical protein
VNEQYDESEDQVSRLLAAAAGPPAETQVPEDVAHRLDDVLAGLVSERIPSATGPVPPDEVTGVTQLDPHRRRKRWPQLLVAAAAVSVIGIGVGNLLGDAQPEASSGASSADAVHGGELERGGIAEGGDTAEDGSRAEADKPADSDSANGQVAPEVQRDNDPTALSERPLPPRLRTSSLTVDLQRIEAFSLAVPVSDTPGRWSRACVQPRTGRGDEWLPVRLDGERAVLVLRPPADGRRTADVFTCDDATDPAASTTLDAQ